MPKNELELKENHMNIKIEEDKDSIKRNLISWFKKDYTQTLDNSFSNANKNNENIDEYKTTTSLLFTRKKIARKPLNTSVTKKNYQNSTTENNDFKQSENLEHSNTDVNNTY